MTQEMIKEYLAEYCKGRRRAQNSRIVEQAFNMSGNELRRTVARLRRKNVPVCSGPEGYYYAENAAEVYSTIRQLKLMRSGLDEAIAGLERAFERFGITGRDGG